MILISTNVLPSPISNRLVTTKLTEPTEQPEVKLHPGQALKLTVAKLCKKLYIQDFIKGCDCVLMWRCSRER